MMKHLRVESVLEGSTGFRRRGTGGGVGEGGRGASCLLLLSSQGIIYPPPPSLSSLHARLKGRLNWRKALVASRDVYLSNKTSPTSILEKKGTSSTELPADRLRRRRRGRKTKRRFLTTVRAALCAWNSSFNLTTESLMN